MVQSDAKWCQTELNGAKRGQTGSNWSKRGQKGPYGAKRGQKGQTGQTGQMMPNGVKWGWFFMRFWWGSTKTVVEFLVLVRGIFLYHLRAYLNGFVFSHGSKFLGAPFMVKTWFLCLFFEFKAILGHEGGTQIFRAVAQNKAIQISFQMI